MDPPLDDNQMFSFFDFSSPECAPQIAKEKNRKDHHRDKEWRNSINSSRKEKEITKLVPQRLPPNSQASDSSDVEKEFDVLLER